MTVEIIPGMRFNRLTTAHPTKNPMRKGQFWICRCDCGGERAVYAGHLRDGSAKSCGCLVGGNNRTHGMSKTPEYRAWDNARSRCYREKDRKYPLYGGRGIKMCDAWRKSFEKFFADMGPRPSPNHTLDRYPNGDGNYEPSNCRWATIEDQNNNRSINRYITVNGERLTIAKASKKTGIPHGTILGRLNRGMSDDEVIRNG